MKKLILLIGSIALLGSNTTFAKEKDIFKENGFNKAPLTLSHGRYNEFFMNEEVVQIGTVLLNTKTNKVVAFLEEDTTKTKYLAEFSSRWLSPDPLAEKYYSVSPYVYCMNNPIKYIDPDGRKIEYATGTSQEFKNKFATTVKFMNEKGTSGIIAKLQESPKTYYLSETSGKINKFNVTKDGAMTIEWNPNLAKITNEGVSLSPATLLNHEADHANQYGENSIQFKNDTDPLTGNDAQYDSKEEKRVIEGSEQITAKKHGEIKDGEVTRTDHGVSGFRPVNDPRKNGEVTITAQ